MTTVEQFLRRKAALPAALPAWRESRPLRVTTGDPGRLRAVGGPLE